MTGREIIIEYFRRNQYGTLRQIVLSSKGKFINEAKIGCALHDMKLRREIKGMKGIYTLDECTNVEVLAEKPAPIKPASYVDGQYQSGNKWLTELLRAVR